MLVRLAPGMSPAIAMTGSKTPCISLYRPVGFDGPSSLLSEGLWEAGAIRHDALARDASARTQMRNRIAAAEVHILPAIEAGRPDVAEALVTAWDDHGLAAGSGSVEMDARSG